MIKKYLICRIKNCIFFFQKRKKQKIFSNLCCHLSRIYYYFIYRYCSELFFLYSDTNFGKVAPYLPMAVSLYKQMKGRWTMIKRVSLALVALGLSASAYAAHPVEEMLPAAPPTVAVTIPQQTGSWSVGVEALYQALGTNDFNFATSGDASLVGNEGQTGDLYYTHIEGHMSAKSHDVKPNYDWGWQVDVAYLFPGNGNDVELSWKHIDSSETRHINNNGGVLVGPGMFVPESLVETSGDIFNGGLWVDGGWDHASGKERNDYDHVDLVFGQKMDFGQKVTLKPFGGLRYASIETKNTGHYHGMVEQIIDAEDSSIVLDHEVHGMYHSKSEYQGVGPRAGLDAKVRIGAGFSITGTVGGSLLIGQQDNKIHAKLAHSMQAYNDDNNGNITQVLDGKADMNVHAKNDSNSRVVPELDTRIGLNYGWAFNPDAALEVELGYEAINYFNLRQNGMQSFVDSNSNSTNFSVRGPYLRAQLDLA